MGNLGLESYEFLNRDHGEDCCNNQLLLNETIIGPGRKLSRQELMDRWIIRLVKDANANKEEYFYPIAVRRFEGVTGKIFNPKTHLLVCMNTYSKVVPEGYNNLEPMFVVFKKKVKEEDNKVPFVMPIDDPFYLMGLKKTEDLVKHTLEQPICLNLDDGNIYFTEETDMDLSQGLIPTQS